MTSRTVLRHVLLGLVSLVVATAGLLTTVVPAQADEAPKVLLLLTCVVVEREPYTRGLVGVVLPLKLDVAVVGAPSGQPVFASAPSSNNPPSTPTGPTSRSPQRSISSQAAPPSRRARHQQDDAERVAELHRRRDRAGAGGRGAELVDEVDEQHLGPGRSC